jgi:hypothetical protein
MVNNQPIVQAKLAKERKIPLKERKENTNV